MRKTIPAIVLCVLAGAAGATPIPQNLCDETIATYYNQFGNAPVNPPSLAAAFDDDETTGVLVSEYGASIVLDFSGRVSTDKPKVYVDSIEVVHTGKANLSLWTADIVKEGNTTTTNWTPVSENVRPVAGLNVYRPSIRALLVKYVFETASAEDLKEFRVKGWVSSEPQKVSSASLAKNYNPDGTLAGGDGTGGFGGGAGIRHWFDGNKKTNGGLWDGGGGTWLPNLSNGGWCLIDFSSVVPGGYYITDVSVSQCSDFEYSIYWLDDESVVTDRSTWHPVDDAIYVSKVGEAIYGVNETATKVVVYFDKTGGWTVNIAEIEVWGMDPADIGCKHPSFTEWTEVEGSASCLLPGTDERFCTVCGTRFTREQETGLGHDFVSHLLISGAYRKFGSGYIDCSRCDWRLDFPLDTNSLWNTMPLDLVTNRVNGTQIGRVALKGQFPFTEISVTSTGNGPGDPSGNWGVNPVSMIDNKWDWVWQNYWYSMRGDANPHVDYVFGTEIDLAWIDVATDNANYTNLFLSVEEVDGEEVETPLAAVSAFTADETHREGVEAVVFTRNSFSMTEDAEPVSGKTYYALEVVGEGADERAQWTPVSGLQAFEEGTSYFEASATGAAWCTKDGDNYVQIETPSVFTSDEEYYVQSATTDGNYYTESSGKYVSAGKRTSFAVNTTYYRTTGVTTGSDLPVIVDAHSDVTRVQIRFYAQPVRHLRLRQINPNGKVRAPMYVSELHPWGTVRGAGDLRYRKETLMIFR